MSISMEELKRAIKEVVKEELGQNNQLTESHVNHICGCKDCYCDMIRKMEAFPYRCSDCGLPLPDSMVGVGTPPCPRCGSTEAYEYKK